jgi:serine/threonine protein phosphatase PrpC
VDPADRIDPAEPADRPGPADHDDAADHDDPAEPATGPVGAPVAGSGSRAPESTNLRAALEALADAADPACPQCGDTAPPASDGACPVCGTRRPAPRDHVEMRLGPTAAVTDRGLRRRRNEDAVALGRVGEVWVAVVCDGVASARRGDEASLAAVESAVDAGLAAATTGSPIEAVAASASDAAAGAAAGLGRGGGDSPACTYVAAVVRGGEAIVSWVGDSRVYWLASDGSSRLLSTDDSWAEEIAAAGLMSRDDAAADRRAHVLTRWLGEDSPAGPARARRVRLGTTGQILLCSDGLWNHIPDPAVLARLVTGEDALDDALALVGAALDDGGYDNATVALVPVVPPEGGDPRPSVAIDARGPDERTGPIPLAGGSGS